MAKYQKAPDEVSEMADAILAEFDTHRPLVSAGVTIDYVAAYAEVNKDGERVGCAIKHHGVQAIGLSRKMSLKDRAMGRADAEICIDFDWWTDASEESRRALLDHELHHLEVKCDEDGVVRDDLNRPVLSIRKHDFQFGWFTLIAARHGEHSMERIQATQIKCESGQYFWPELIDAAKLPPTKQKARRRLEAHTGPHEDLTTTTI